MIYCQSEGFLSKINLRYHHISLGQRIGPPKILRSKKRILNTCDLEKWKISVFLYLITSPNYSRRDEITLQKRWEFNF